MVPARTREWGHQKMSGQLLGEEEHDGLQSNLREVIEMLLEDGEPQLESEFVGTANVRVA